MARAAVGGRSACAEQRRQGCATKDLWPSAGQNIT